ncbi:MAG: DMT family transporter [Pseudorhodoplanes sp.]
MTAIGATIAGMALYSASDIVSKYIGTAYSPSQLLFFRSLIAVVFVAVMLVATGQFRGFPGIFNRIAMLRSLFDCSSNVSFLVAVVHLPLSVMISLAMTAPLILTALSAVFFNEHVGWRRWAAVAFGFAGAILVVKPSPTSLDLWMILALCCALFSALRDITTFRVGTAVPSLVLTLAAAVASVIGGALLGLQEKWMPFTRLDFGILCTGAAFHCLGMLVMVIATRIANPSIIAPFRYTVLIWAVLAGYFFFGEVPDGWAIVGGMMIVGSGIYTAHRQRVAHAAAVTPAAKP